MSNQLLPCPFCNASMSIESNRDWHRIVGEHDERCLFMHRETVTVPATDEQLALAVRDWNRRATQPAASEPVADVRGAFEEVWSQAMCNDEGVPGPKPLRSLVDPEEYRGGGVKFAWRWFQRGAQAYAPPAAAPVAAGEPQTADFPVAIQARIPGGAWSIYNLGDAPELKSAGMEMRGLYPAPPAAYPVAIKLPPAQYFGPEAGYEFSSYEQGELQGRCDMWELIRKMNTPPAAAHGASEFFVDFDTLRKALTIYGLAAPVSNEELGLQMERQAIRVIEAVAKMPFPTSAAAHGDEAEPSVDFAAWLIDHREGQVVTEEDMHEWLGEWYEQRLAKRAKGEGGAA